MIGACFRRIHIRHVHPRISHSLANPLFYTVAFDTFNGTTFLCSNLSLALHTSRPSILVFYLCPIHAYLLIMNLASNAVWSSLNLSHSNIAMVSENAHDRAPNSTISFIHGHRLFSACRNLDDPHDGFQSRERALSCGFRPSFNPAFSAVGRIDPSDDSSCDDLPQRVGEVLYVQDPI